MGSAAWWQWIFRLQEEREIRWSDKMFAYSLGLISMELYPNRLYPIEKFLQLPNSQTLHVERSLFLLSNKPIYNINLRPVNGKCKVWDEEKHKGIWSELWINYANYHTNPTALLSINIYKQQPERSDVSASRINVALSKREVGSWCDVSFAFNTL
jgi:hypothetical protein